MYNVSKHERLRPLFRNCVVLRFICLVDDGNAVGDNGEDDLRRQKKFCRGNLCFSESFYRGSTSGEVDDVTAGAGQTTQSSLRHVPVTEVMICKGSFGLQDYKNAGIGKTPK